MTPLTGDPLHVIHTLVFQPADYNPTFATKPAAQIKAPPGITTSALDMQFRHLLEEPLLELAKEHDLGPVVIALDALDECDTAETRKELLHTLSDDLARLPSMFRLLISRQDEPDIRAAILCLDIDVHDAPIGDGRHRLTSSCCLNGVLPATPGPLQTVSCRLIGVWMSFHLGIYNHSLH